MERAFNGWQWQAIFGEALSHDQTGGVHKWIKSPDCQTFLLVKKRINKQVRQKVAGE